MTPEICPTFLCCNRVSGGNAEDDDGFKHDWNKTLRINVPLYDFQDTYMLPNIFLFAFCTTVSFSILCKMTKLLYFLLFNIVNVF